uniref:Myeloid differentiation primary response protein MyD88 n=1 Tax=Timema douglasi TaxID=61478 RepID=A0A7R8ZBG4_TIMDO|nr:unnamed protein product [Timema douglasi]
MTPASEVPLHALRSNTREVLSGLLNPLKVLPTEDGLPRDWRGLAQLAGLQGHIISMLVENRDPTNKVLEAWPESSFGKLQDALGHLDRWDVLDDTAAMMEKDATEYSKLQIKANSTAPTINTEVDRQVLTVDDVIRLNKGLDPQNYDAFLLYAEEDEEFAKEIMSQMEDKFGLKLCEKNRDLVGGLTFEHEAIMKLIAERCNRLIVVVSPSFLKSEVIKFFLTFAQALGIDQRQRKVVPCLYQRCKLPPELSYYFFLDYTRSGKLWDFWTKLRDSIQTPTVSPRIEQHSHYMKTSAGDSSSLKIKLDKVSHYQTTVSKVNDKSNVPTASFYSQKTLELTPGLSSEQFPSVSHLDLREKSLSLENIGPKNTNWFQRLKILKKKKQPEAI